VSTSVIPSNADLQEIFFCLLEPYTVPNDRALALYVTMDGSQWLYRGMISNQQPSEVCPLLLPTSGDVSDRIQIGVALEPLAEASLKEGSKLKVKEEYTRRVGLDLFNFLQSFGNVTTFGSDKIVVPSNALDRWYTRVSTRLRKDPEFLTKIASA
jgi:hypothetical protein